MRLVHRLSSAGRRVAVDPFIRGWDDPLGGWQMRRRLGAVALILVIAVVSCTPAATTPPKPTGKDFAPAAIPITTAVVTQGSIAATLVYSGNVQARSTVNVVPKITGRVEQLMVDIGDEVRQGEVIAQLDRAALDAQVLLAKVDLLLHGSLNHVARSPSGHQRHTGAVTLRAPRHRCEAIGRRSPQ